MYIILLSCLLVSFLLGTVIEDWSRHHWLLTAVDVLFAIPTLAFLIAYGYSSTSMDTKEAIARQSRKQILGTFAEFRALTKKIAARFPAEGHLY